MKVIKRDGREVDFSIEKISQAIFAAAKSVGGDDFSVAVDIAMSIEKSIKTQNVEEIDIESIQDMVEKELIERGHAKTAKAFILYRQKRNDARSMKSVENKVIADLVFVDAANMDDKRENANIDGNSTMGAMLKIGGTVAKEFNLKNLIKPKHAVMHNEGKVHMHDLDFMALTINCLQIPMDKLLDNGFNTGHGCLRTPTTIGSAATLTCIAIQSNQNEMFGGQSIPAFDFYLAPYVAKSFVRNCGLFLQTIPLDGELIDEKIIKEKLIKPADQYIEDNKRIMNEKGREYISFLIRDILFGEDAEGIENEINHTAIETTLNRIFEFADRKTDKDTYQAMEATIHNLCTLSSRAGGQVPFSSLNTGTDISTEGRLITKNLFLATEAGLGSGETAIFPISIMKMKKGITDKDSPNYDLFQLACRCSAKRLFPNFVNIDAPFNLQYYVEGHPETEIATMGCRTRVIGNIYGKDKSITPGRGNLFPITINLPFIALEAKEEVDEKGGDLYDIFMRRVTERLDDVFDMLADRFEVVAKRKAKNYPFLMGQHLYMGSENLAPDDEIREVIKNGTLVAGFIGLAETLVVLFGKHHGESAESQEKGLEIIKYMYDYTSKHAEKTNMNYSFMAAPAEGCCGRLLKATRKRFGIVPGVTDREYLTNSFHVPVYYPISAYKKVELEAPYHALCPAG